MNVHHYNDGFRLVERSPTHCPVGHPLGPNQVLVGTQPCLCAGLVHRTWQCVRCKAVQAWPACVTHPQWTLWSGVDLDDVAGT